jgi:hypothetical protein
LPLAGLALLAASACGSSDSTNTPTAEPAGGAVSSAPGCEDTQTAWFDAQRRGLGGTSGANSLEQVGDCWVRSGETQRAVDFYRAVKGRLSTNVCGLEGIACPVLASEELRRIDCGGQWVAPSAETAWRDFLTALDRDPAQPASARIEPEVRVWTPGPAALEERCNASAFDLPLSVRRERDRVRREVMSKAPDWLAPAVFVRMGSPDVPWKNYSPTIYTFFLVRACPLDRPAPGAASGFFIRIEPVESETTNPPCEL